MNTTVPNNPRSFVETMLHSAHDADKLASENINDRKLLEAHTHAAINGYVAAYAMEALRRSDPDTAQGLAETLNRALTAGDLTGPIHRTAQGLNLDVDQWTTDFNERAARRLAKESGRA